jgi:lipoate synthase
MNLSETSALIAKVSVVDNRKTKDPVMVRVWQEVLAEIPLWAADQALTKFRRETPGVWVEPGHIFQIANPVVKHNIERVKYARRIGLLDDSWGTTQELTSQMTQMLYKIQRRREWMMFDGTTEEDAAEKFQSMRDEWQALLNLDTQSLQPSKRIGY